MKKALEIVGGWEQYFREKRKTESIFEYMALVYAAQPQEKYLDELEARRTLVTNIYKDIALYMAKIWETTGRKQMELLEYEQYYQIWNDKIGLIEKEIDELLIYYREMMVTETDEISVEIMQIYTDRGEYEKASFWMQKGEQIQQENRGKTSENMFHIPENKEDVNTYNLSTAQKLQHIFAGREDIFSIETIGYGGKRQTEMQPVPLSEQKVLEHLQGAVTIGTYIQRPNSTVKYMVIDVDISKKIMLQTKRENPVFQSHLQQAWNQAEKIRKIVESFGMYGYTEYSGCRGYHVWILFTEWIPVRYVNMFADAMEHKLQTRSRMKSVLNFSQTKQESKQESMGR